MKHINHILTPRTDNLLFGLPNKYYNEGVVPIHFARQLETELAEARELVKRIGTVPDSDLILKQKQFLKEVDSE